MSFKLSKEERERREEIASKLREQAEKVAGAVSAMNDAMTAAREIVEAEVEAYNAIVSEAEEFAQDVASQADEAISEKSEKWQEGERGQAAEQWKGEWEGLQFDELSVDTLGDIDWDDPTHADDLESAPDSIAEFA